MNYIGLPGGVGSRQLWFTAADLFTEKGETLMVLAAAQGGAVCRAKLEKLS